jgi:hypothetical protein
MFLVEKRELTRLRKKVTKLWKDEYRKITTAIFSSGLTYTILDIEPIQEEIELWKQVIRSPEELQTRKERAERHRESMNKVFPTNGAVSN